MWMLEGLIMVIIWASGVGTIYIMHHACHRQWRDGDYLHYASSNLTKFSLGRSEIKLKIYLQK